MKTVSLLPPDDLTVPSLRLVCVKGVPVDIPENVAGREPDPRVAEAMAELAAAVAAIDHERAKALREEITTLDHGVGLLAQGWTRAASAPAAPTPPPAADKADEADKKAARNTGRNR